MNHGKNYPEHLTILDRDLGRSLEIAGRKGLDLNGVLFHAGSLSTYHGDDRLVPFAAAGHVRRWVPLAGPEHAVLARPGRKPLVVRVQPQDYWYDTSPPPHSFWEDSVDLEQVETFEEIAQVVGSLNGVAYVGESAAAAASLGIDGNLVEPKALMAPLDWFRAYKTQYELDCLRKAAEHAAAGHQRALEVFRLGASERQVHWAFLEASGQLEFEVPYETIVAFDQKAAILHYQHKRGPEAAPGQVFLLDAGAACEGYAADITRTWFQPEVDETFQALVRGVDAFERDLVAMVTAGRPYLEIHVEAHRRTAGLLAELGLVTCSAEEAFESGITRTFLPHGVGHQLGAQVHDVGGHQAGPEGGEVPPPEEYPFLRNTRILEPGHVVTIEPGIYFVPMLLAPLRETAEGKLLDWTLVDRLTPLGGVRIEDNIVCTDSGPLDFTRDLIAGP